MPTGYTAELDDNPELTTAKWVTESLTRNFGLLYLLRDGPYDLSDDEIEKYLEGKVGGSSYHQERIGEARDTLKIIEADPTTWNGLYTTTVERLTNYNKRSREEAQITKKRHENAEADLLKLRDSTYDEITRNIAKFGLSQLELVKSDREPYIQEIPTFEKFKADKLASLNRDVEYHSKSLAEEKARARERLIAYQRVREEVARILEVHSSAPSVNEVET